MKRIFTFYSLLSLSITVAEAQSLSSGMVTGKVIDKSTQKPLDFATVSVVDKESGKVITGSISDTKGEFSIHNIPHGNFIVNVDFIGYEKTSVDNISINDNSHLVSLGTISLSPSMLVLGEVSVVGDKPVIENKLGTIIYNVSSDITSQGGLAIDVLKKVPEVTVDVDGNVELQGNSNIRFLINGKTSSLFGNNIADALASIPASQIKTIEAITNPGAKYDSQGTGGIINIILQDNKLQGASGNISLTAGTRLENGSANFSMKKNNFGVNAFFGGNWVLTSEGKYSTDRETTDTTASLVTKLLQDGLNSYDRKGFRSGLGFEWNLSKTNTLNGSVGYNQFGFGSSGLTNQQQYTTDSLGDIISEYYTTRNSESRRKFSSVDWSLDYKKDFKKEGHELGIVISSSYGRPDSRYTQTQIYQGELIPFSGSTNNNPGKDNQMDITVDYINPVSENFRIETGIKAAYQNLTSVADVSVFSNVMNDYIYDPLQSYDLRYIQKIYAGYFSSSFKLFNFLDLKPGLRYEYTDVDIDYPNTSVPSYGTLVPSLVLSHNFNEKRSLQLAYSKRIERPGYRQLNPFLNRSDPYFITTGNIYLNPEIGNNIELSYNTGFKKGGNLRFTIMERITTEEIEDVTVFYPEYAIGDSIYKNVLVSSGQNIGEEYNTGFSIFGSYPVTRKFNVRGNFMISNRYIMSNQSVGNVSTGFNTRFNMNVTYQLPKDLVFEAFGFYRSGGRNLQGRRPQFFIYNFAFRKRFWDKNGSLGLTATNPFSRSIRQVTTIKTEYSVSSNLQELPFRSFGINFTYKFGKFESKNRNEGEGIGIEGGFN